MKVLAAALLCLSCAAGAQQPPSCTKPLGTLVARSLRDLPKPVQGAVRSSVPDIVDAAEPFDNTDVVRHGAHFNRFAFAWNSGPDWVVATEHGGIAYNTPVFLLHWTSASKTAETTAKETAFPQTLCATASRLLKSAYAPAPLQVPAWQKTAGGSMSFDVATIKPADPDHFHPPNFALSADDAYGNVGGNFSGEFSLSVFVQFAYKLTLSEAQRKAMLAQLPEWVSKEKFAIHAKAEGNPTKDQMRLMVQSLSADRFAFKAHLEMQEQSVLAAQLIRPGKPGPNLISHDQGPPCPAYGNAGDAMRGASGPDFPPICDIVAAHETKDHMEEAGARNAPPAMMASLFSQMGELDRTVIDQTGLKGRYDFRIKWSPDPGSKTQPSGAVVPEPQGPPFVQALREQLGIKLQATRATLPVLVVDHIERPTPN